MQKILIVEDDLAIQALLHDFIQEAGYEVTLASDGVEALCLLYTSPSPRDSTSPRMPSSA